LWANDGPRSKREQGELPDRRERSKEIREAGVVPDEAAVRLLGFSREFVERLTPTPWRCHDPGLPRKEREQRCGDGCLQVPLRQPREPVLERDRLALLGQLQPTVDRPGRLRENCRVPGAAATSSRAAATLEERQLDLSLPAH